MSSEQVAIGSVGLGYHLTEEDWLDGFIAHRRRVRRPWLVPVLLAGAVVGILLGHFASDSSWALSLTDVVVMAVVTVFGIGFGLLLHRFPVGASWVCRWQVRLLMRANPLLSEPIRAVLDDSGLRLASASRTETPAWSQYLRYVESDRSFVLRASERLGAAVLVLPKRGLDTDRRSSSR